jgi:hypothetical protein
LLLAGVCRGELQIGLERQIKSDETKRREGEERREQDDSIRYETKRREEVVVAASPPAEDTGISHTLFHLPITENWND